MKREILFRGRYAREKAWVYGSLIAGSRIFDNDEHGGMLHPIDFNTVGQYTGLKDKNGKKIFEGDILAQEGETVGFPVRCGVHSCAACGGVVGVYGFACAYDTYCISRHEKLVVIGNIYDNPELMGGGEHGIS